MARATTQKFEELIIEVEFDPVNSQGTYSKICGIQDAEINRTSEVDTSEVPDCDDESLPLAKEREVRSQEVIVTGTGVWAQESNGKLRTWWGDGSTLNVRVTNANAASGDPAEEEGPALLSQLNNARTKGQKVSAQIQIEFDGLPAVTNASNS